MHKLVRVFIDKILGRFFRIACSLRNLHSVLVGAGKKIHVVAKHAAVTCHAITLHKFHRKTDMWLSVGVSDRGGEIKRRH